jgi:hypothetical protein
MSNASIDYRYKYFWIRIRPDRQFGGAVVQGTLICEDQEDIILQEARCFVSAHLQRISDRWLVDILRPSGSPIRLSQSVETFFEGRRADLSQKGKPNAEIENTASDSEERPDEAPHEGVRSNDSSHNAEVSQVITRRI